mmetsp:Transcript_47137/g.111019  ORF Transcript_47137/g.111019 Transcript_47137/m.111019 type:complete len:292 (+) Transcript_47137:284-1159(+)
MPLGSKKGEAIKSPKVVAPPKVSEASQATPLHVASPRAPIASSNAPDDKITQPAERDADMVKEVGRQAQDSWAGGAILQSSLFAHQGGVICTHLQGGKIYSGGRDQSVQVWDVATGQREHKFSGHTSLVRCIKARGANIMSGGDDCRIWSVEEGGDEQKLDEHSHFVSALDCDAHSTLVTGSWDKTIRVWDTRDGSCTATMQGHTSAVLCLQLRNDRLVSGSLGGELKFWSISSGTCTATVTASPGCAVSALVWYDRFVICAVDSELMSYPPYAPPPTPHVWSPCDTLSVA